MTTTPPSREHPGIVQMRNTLWGWRKQAGIDSQGLRFRAAIQDCLGEVGAEEKLDA